jgi:hypothetical protein
MYSTSKNTQITGNTPLTHNVRTPFHPYIPSMTTTASHISGKESCIRKW